MFLDHISLLFLFPLAFSLSPSSFFFSLSFKFLAP
uniref:Uncharacterized protein n=1 Tax=Phakopsora pachyrhizi TaxID=170000 RepID=A0A0S1MJQ3_PHAPC